MRKVFLDDLPRKEYRGKIVFDWKKSLGYKIKFIYDNLEGWIEIINYFEDGIILLKYNNKEHKIKSGNFTRCQLGIIIGMITSEFKIEIGQTFKDEKRDITITDREYRIRYDKNNNKYKDRWYRYTCNKCGWTEGWIVESALIRKRGTGCSCCAGYTLVEGINDIPTVAPWLIPYFQSGYDEAKRYNKWGHGNINNPKGYIYPICPDCGRVKSKKINISNIYKNKSIGCSCGDGISKPNKMMFNVLEQLNVVFETEYSPKWCKYLFKDKYRQGSYDFYFELNKKKYIIEMDGGFHTKDNNRNRQTKEESLYIDDEKDRLALEHGIKVIRIDCDYGGSTDGVEYIKQNILKDKKINKLFDLSKINWIKVNDFTISNLAKITCQHKKNNPNLTTGNLMKIMKLGRTAILTYLKQGNGIWCNYYPKEEMRKSANKSNYKKRKSIIVLKNGIIVNIFESGTELIEKFKILYGIKLSFGEISKVCSGVRNHHKGYTFKYIEDLTSEEYIKYNIKNKLKELHNKELVQVC
jgi:very-short-patch-repair endonuclease